jgi:RNA polymerase sigma factor (TIGR02999 family)
MVSPKEVTKILTDWRKGDATALDRLIPVVHNELHRLAGKYLREGRQDNTFQATVLIQEAYIRLADEQDIEWKDRVHFFAVAARMMRRILVNYSQFCKNEKRDDNVLRLSLNEAIGSPEERYIDILLLHEALNSLAAVDPRKSQIVELRLFAGLNNEEVAEVLNVSLATVNREWRVTKAWLYKEALKDGHVRS